MSTALATIENNLPGMVRRTVALAATTAQVDQRLIDSVRAAHPRLSFATIRRPAVELPFAGAKWESLVVTAPHGLQLVIDTKLHIAEPRGKTFRYRAYPTLRCHGVAIESISAAPLEHLLDGLLDGLLWLDTVAAGRKLHRNLHQGSDAPQALMIDTALHELTAASAILAEEIAGCFEKDSVWKLAPSRGELRWQASIGRPFRSISLLAALLPASTLSVSVAQKRGQREITVEKVNGDQRSPRTFPDGKAAGGYARGVLIAVTGILKSS